MKRAGAVLLLLGIAGMASAQEKQNLANGFAVDKSYQLNDLDQINTFNGVLNMNIPLGQRYPAGGALSYQFVLSYGGSPWSFEAEFTTYEGSPDDDPANWGTHVITVETAYPWSLSQGGQRHPGNAGFGWTLSLGKMEGDDTYVSADGAKHEFVDFLHENVSGEKVAGVKYTRDGTYLRRKVVAGFIQVEFPDGTYHRFENGGKRRLRFMNDRFGNEVEVKYEPDSRCASDSTQCVDDWVVTDGSRSHTVDMILLTGVAGAESYTYEVASRLLLATAAGQAAYTFGYDDGAGVDGVPRLTGISKRIAKNQDCRQPSVALVPILKTITLPDSSQFEITTAVGNATWNGHAWVGAFSSPDGQGGEHPKQDCSGYSSVVVHESFSGIVTSIRRPTGAITSWTPKLYDFPPLTVAPTDTCPDTFACQRFHRTDRDSVGVSERVDRSRDNTLLSKRTYTHVYVPASETSSTTIATYDANSIVSSSQHYYRVPTGSDTAEYGLPFTRNAPLTAAGPFLSARVRDAGDNTLSETYVLYEAEAPSKPGEDPSSGNRRVKQQRVRTYDTKGALTNDVTTTSNDFDGLGHYRVATTSSETLGAVPGVSRTVTTFYNKLDPQTDPAAEYKGTQNEVFLPFGHDRNWVIDTYSSQTVKSGSSSAKTLFAFDLSTGFLNRKRTLATISTNDTHTVGVNDLVSVFAHTNGNVTSEQYYGGDDENGLDDDDDQWLGTEPLVSLALPAAPAVSLTHAYSHGAVAWSQYGSIGFRSVDREIDSNTGLTTVSTDPAQVKTGFEYDWAGRLVWSTPIGAAVTEYDFDPARIVSGLFQPATVRINQRKGSKTAEVLVTAIVTYDQLGRVSTEARRMPDGTDSSRQTTYNQRGLVATLSEWGNENAVTSYTYDALGRVQTMTAPDTSVVNFSYGGSRSTTRQTKVATCADTASAQCNTSTDTWASGQTTTTEETMDDFGRLHQVTEPGGTITTYGYDMADRLVSVNVAGQPRSFEYDGRGFLNEETHPESGTTTYKYDARGHVTSRTAAEGTASATTVEFAYDAAERLTKVSDATGDLKVFSYDRSSADRSMGKLASATRHNRGLPDGTLEVKETYHYDGTDNLAGRLSTKVTTIGGSAQTFTDSYRYDRLGTVESVTYPSCVGCGTLVAPTRTVSSTYKAGFLTSVAGYTATVDGLTYWPNGMVQEVKRRNADGSDGPVDRYEIDTTAIGMPRPLSITFSGFCNDFRVEDLASKSVNAGASAELTVTAPGATTFQWFEVQADGSEVKLTAQTTSKLTTTVSTTSRFRVRAGNGSCTIDSNIATVSAGACAAPNVSITLASTLTRNRAAQASVPGTANTTYLWTVTGGTITSGENASTVHFTVGCDAALVNVEVRVKPSCSDTPTLASKASNTSARVSVDLSAERSTIPEGSSEPIIVALTGTGPWDVSWSDGASSRQTTTSFQRLVTPAGTTTYTATVTDANGCQANDSLQITVTAPPPTAPTNFTATAISATQVQISWSYSGSFNSFEVERRSAGGSYEWELLTTGTSSIRSASPNSAYLFRVRTLKGAMASEWSNVDLASTAVFGVDVTAGTPMAASHVTQLRTAVNAMRALWNSSLAPLTFTDPTLQGGAAKAIHLVEIRNALNAARQGLGLSAWGYTTPPPAAGQVCAAADVNDLRGGVR